MNLLANSQFRWLFEVAQGQSALRVETWEWELLRLCRLPAEAGFSWT